MVARRPAASYVVAMVADGVAIEARRPAVS
jgi:hypothetical protein